MFSFSKLLLLALLTGIVWFGWRWLQRVDTVRRGQVRRQAAPSPYHNQRVEPAGGPHTAQDMEKCPECGAYVAPHSAIACGRPGCPYGR